MASAPVDPAYGPTWGTDPAPLLAALRSPACHATVAAICQGLTVPDTPAHLLTWYQRRGEGMPVEAVVGTVEAQLNEEGGIGPTAAFLKRRSMPVLAVHRDPTFAAWEQETLRDDGHSRVVVWEGPGHWIHQERPEQFTALVLDWAQETAAQAGGGPVRSRAG